MMSVCFDNILGKKIIPNGIVSERLINLYLSNIRYFNNVTYIRHPRIVTVLKNYLDIQRVSSKTKGIYPIAFMQPSILSNKYCKYFVKFAINEKILSKNNNFKIIFHLEDEPFEEKHLFNLLNELQSSNINNFKIYSNLLPKNYENDTYLKSKIMPSAGYEMHEFLRHYDLTIGKKFKIRKKDIHINDNITFSVHKELKSVVLCYTNLNYDFRAAAVYLLLKKNFNDCCAITYNNKSKPSKNITQNSPHIQSILDKRDFDDTVKNTHNYVPLKDLQKTKFLLSIEAYFCDQMSKTPYVTEKSIKCILLNKPFLILGQKGSLKELKRKGYKTFHPFIDESYDNIVDHDERFFEVLNQFEKLLALPDNDLNILIKNLSPIIKHNYNNFLKIVQEQLETYSDAKIIF